MILIVSLSCSLAAEPEDPLAEGNWVLQWEDEFDGSAIDNARWKFETGTGQGGWGNNELEYYTNRVENARVENGSLVITARKEAYAGSAYTSARLKTQDLKSFTYGRIEARIKLPYGQGIWPAFWMLGDSIATVGWPRCGEIDILEMVGGETPQDASRGDRAAVGTVHWADSSGTHRYQGSSTASEDGRLADDYHVFSIVWDESSITWYMDGESYYRFDTASSGSAAFDQGFFILLNLAVGGNWPGSPDASTEFPQRMYVDWVRYYRSAK